MSGLCGFGGKPGMRRLPRPAGWGSCPDLVSVPRLPERRSRAGSGDGRPYLCGGSGRGVERFVPCKATVRALSDRTSPALSSSAPRPAARVFPAPPKGATCGVQPRCVTGAAKRPCRRPAGGIPGAPSRGASKAAASSRHALLLRRVSVVTSAQRTATRSERASDDAPHLNRLSTENVDTQRRKQGLRRARGWSWSGAEWCQGSHAGFSSGNLLRSRCSMPAGRDRDRGAALRAGGTLYFEAF